MPELHAPRRARALEELARLDADALLVTSLVNVRYLSGFSGSNAALLLTPDSVLLATDGRYVTQASQESPDVEVVVDRACAAAVVGRVGDGATRLAFEDHVMTVGAHRDLATDHASVRWVDGERLVETLRRVKDDTEIALLEEACAIGDRAFAALLPTLRPGDTERQVARRLENLMYDEGATALAFDTIVAAGPSSAIPHHQPTDRPVEPGDLLKMDFGAALDGYHADMTRTLVVGAPPEPWQEDLYALVAAAQAAGRAALAPGADVQAVDRAARSIIEEGGFGEQFGHGLGHGVGLEIHEAPLIGPLWTGILDARSPVTVEPGVYLPGRGGVRIEDTLVVRDDGPQLLTTTTKELLVV